MTRDSGTLPHKTMVKKNSKPAKQQSSNNKQNQIRMSEPFKDRIRKYQAKMQGKGFEMTFASAVRTLVGRGLEAEGIR